MAVKRMMMIMWVIVAFQITTKKNTFKGIVAQDAATKKNTTIFEVVEVCENLDPSNCDDSESDESDDGELNTEDIQKAYQEMFDH